jgi:plastocyanin
LLFSDTGESQNDSYGNAISIVNDVNGDGLDDLVVGADTISDTLFSVGKIYAYYGVAGGCRPQLQLTQSVSLAAFPAISDTSVITVPSDAAVLYNYIVRNTGNVTLTQHNVVDSQLGLVEQTAYTLTPGAGISINITNIPGLLATPGANISHVTTWTGGISIVSPSGVTLPANRLLSALATATSQVNIAGPTTDQDHDGVPDNQEGSDDKDHDGIPAYLDPDEVAVTNPQPTTPETDIAGLSLTLPASAFVNSPVVLSAAITAGTHVTYTWDFGDNQVVTASANDASQTATGQTVTVTHTFTALGTYVVHAMATNSVGQKTTEGSIQIRFQLHMPAILTVGLPESP